MKRLQLGLVGARGFVGSELIRLVAAHPPPAAHAGFTPQPPPPGLRMLRMSPAFTATSMISTSLKSPMSGTRTSLSCATTCSVRP